METLFERFHRRIAAVPLVFTRGIMAEIAWDARLVSIQGTRRVGKTTLMLQYIKQNLPLDGASLYVSLDNIWFAEHSLTGLVDEFVKSGGRYLFLDEVHKYPTWSQEIKNSYDDYPDLKIVFTGSSLLEILNARADLSRRAVMYEMQGLSYREYLNLTLNENLPVYTLKDILSGHGDIARSINQILKPLKELKAYWQNGYYPFFLEQPQLYERRLEEMVNLILEVELPVLRKVEVAYIPKLKQLLQIIAQSVPFMPNVSKLSERIKINRNTLISYLSYLQEAHLTKNLYKNAKGISRLQKPDKVYLENTNLQVLLAMQNADIGHLRETFFINQLSVRHLVEYTDKGDFKVDGNLTFEVGGKGKTAKQVQGLENSFVAADGIEYGLGQKIPLWLFGFLY